MWKTFKYSLLVSAIYLAFVPLANMYANSKVAKKNKKYSKVISTNKKSVASKLIASKLVLEERPHKFNFQETKPIQKPKLIEWGTGKVSWFGGENEYHSAAKLPCALYPNKKVRDLSGNYCAIRYDYDLFPREEWKNITAHISANGKTVKAKIVDYGPHEKTNRIIDLSPSLMDELELKTDDYATVRLETKS